MEQNNYCFTWYHAKYYAYELTKRNTSASIQKLATILLDAQVDLNPHQVEAALFAFKSPLSSGALLADEVGLGKTIEAGLVISQKWAEKKRRILIIVPSSLRKQWYQELSDKFFLPSAIMESSSFNQEIRKGHLNPFDNEMIVICSYHFACSKDAYIKNVSWDLVVLDEAHHLRNVYKPGNRIANAVKNALKNFPKILLTATPLQNSLLELFGLVSMIDEHVFGDLRSFKSQYLHLTAGGNFEELKKRISPICHRTLRRQVREFIKYTNRKAILQEFYPTEAEDKLYNLVSTYLQRDALFALPASQRNLMTLILRRLLASSTFAISGTLEALANKLEAVMDQGKKSPDMDTVVAENYEIYDEQKDEWSDEEQTKEPEKPNFNPEDLLKIEKEMNDLREFQRLAEAISQNSKGMELLRALEKGFEETERLGGTKKAVIFTESTRTQRYLEQILENSDYQGKIVLFNGSNADGKSRGIYRRWLAKHQGTDRVTGSKTADMRAALIDYFRNEAVIMIATEAGAEGINLQFCSLIVNYDLPWNPQRIEQRIGRCHRYGQMFDVVVVNFLNKKNAADQRVYQLLQDKFQLFSGVFGASDEVLGSIESGVDFEKRIAQIYQNCRTSEEIQSCFDQLQNELDDQLKNQISTTRQKLLENFDEEVNDKLRLNLMESKEYLSKYESWLWEITRFYLRNDARFDCQKNSFYLLRNPFSVEKIDPGPYRLGKNVDDAHIYRMGHPLARQIIDSCKKKDLRLRELSFDYSNHLPKISILESCVGKSGWLGIKNLTIDSIESEDHVLIAAFCEDGSYLDPDQCFRLFSLPAAERSLIPETVPDKARAKLESSFADKQAEVLQANMDRNHSFFDQEIDKLDLWAEDIKSGMELEIKELDKEIRAQKTEAKKIPLLEEKVKAQRRIKEMEKHRNTLRQDLYQSQDEVDDRKETLINEIELRLKQKISKTDLFIIKWRVE